MNEPETYEPETLARARELLRPHDGSMVEFWCHRMSQQGKAGAGISGWFRGGVFWSHDWADHYSPGEVTYWRAVRNVTGRAPGKADLGGCAALWRSAQRPATEGLELRAENEDANWTLRNERLPGDSN